MKECGDCTLCCTLLGVEEIKKPIGAACPHCSATQPHCRVYGRRPKKCRDFECGWLVSAELREKFRPDLCHMIITGEDDDMRCHIVHVDPRFPDAPNTPIGKVLLTIVRHAGVYPTIVLITGDDYRVIDDDFTRRLIVERKLAQGKKNPRAGRYDSTALRPAAPVV